MINRGLVIKGKYILPMDGQLSIIQDGMVVVDKNGITAIRKINELEKQYTAREMIDSGDRHSYALAY